MRTGYWLAVLTLAVVVTGAIAFQRGRRSAAAYASRVTLVGTVKEIMQGIVDPSADVLWESVATNITAAGVEEKAPKTDDEWAVVQHSALRLAEAATLLKMEGREIARPGEDTATSGPNAPELTPAEIKVKVARDWSLWLKYADGLQEVAIKALSVTNARDVNGVLEVGDALDKACENCHLQYWYPDDKKPDRARTPGPRGGPASQP